MKDPTDALVHRFRYLPGWAMRRTWVPEHLREECHGAAWIALLECARRFDPTRGVKFITFATWRVKGAVADVIKRDRKQEHYKRTAVAERLHSSSTDEDLRVAEARRFLLSLNPEDRQLLVDYYLNGKTQEELDAELSKSWNSRRFNRALEHARGVRR
jgi:RNA polymerase sigma factor (sigma-70 family)